MRTGLDMKVVVRPLTVLVPRWRDSQATTQCPQADADERRAHQPLAPGGEDFNRRQHLAQQDAEKRHHDDAGGVTESPRPSRDPTPATSVDGKRRDRSQMIGPG